MVKETSTSHLKHLPFALIYCFSTATRYYCVSTDPERGIRKPQMIHLLNFHLSSFLFWKNTVLFLGWDPLNLLTKRLTWELIPLLMLWCHSKVFNDKLYIAMYKCYVGTDNYLHVYSNSVLRKSFMKARRKKYLDILGA